MFLLAHQGLVLVALYYEKEKCIIALAHRLVLKIQTLQIGENSKILCMRLKKQVKGGGWQELQWS